MGIPLLTGGYNLDDAEQALTYYGTKISPSHPETGVLIFLVLMALIIFSDEIFSLFKKGKGKIRLKKNF